MPGKTIPMSVRLSDDDAAFIASLDIEGAATPSDKLRALVNEARQRREGARDHWTCRSMLHDMMGPARQKLGAIERDAHEHSEMIAHQMDWLPDALAFGITQTILAADADEPSKAMRQVEAGLADRIFTLIEDTLRQGVTRQCRAFDPKVIASRLEPTLELARVIMATRQPAMPDTTEHKENK